MNSFRLGLCSVTFRKKTAEEVVNIAKKAGIGYIEWGGDVHVKTLADAKKVKELCEEENNFSYAYSLNDSVENKIRNERS